MALLASQIVNLGFKKRSGWCFTREAEDRVLGWLGINTASRSTPRGHVLLNPVVGVRHLEVERLVAAGTGAGLHPYIPPTYSEPLRYLTSAEPDENWVLEGSGSDRKVVDAVIAALSTAGSAFMAQMADLRFLARRLEGLSSRDQHSAYRWPVALLLSGQRSEALAAASAVRVSLGRRHDRAASELREFLGWFEEQAFGVRRDGGD